MKSTQLEPRSDGLRLRRDQAPDFSGIDRSKAHVGAADGGHGPGGAPAVAVEHGQRPQVDRLGGVVGVDDLAHRVEIGAPVRIQNALSGGPSFRRCS